MAKTLFLFLLISATFYGGWAIHDYEPSLPSFVKRVDVCPSITQWLNITWAESIEGHFVRVLQEVDGLSNQYFYTIRCDKRYEKKPSILGVETETECETRFNIVPAVTKLMGKDGAPIDDSTKWRMIRIPGQCACIKTVEVYHDDFFNL